VIPAECTVPHEFLIDGGRLPGTPSTVVDLKDRRILRAGTGVDRVAEYLLAMG
jgi:L-threonylcarbamoyladenylate synthase